MANVACWYQTQLPTNMIDNLIEDLESLKPDDFLVKSKVVANENEQEGEIKENIRKSNHAWIPSAHWIGGFLWHYVDRINQENFLYDISGYDNNSLQYTQYSKGGYYKLHSDQDITNITYPNEIVRKLSFTLQLSSGNDYTGGDIQFNTVDGKSFLAPRNRGCMIVFDSRTHHQVLPIESGLRKSLVGWIVGPRWK
tara:strand:- start:590 stop:1177 length:588 start_codon:yes stop_codon:yes gene_type:complete